MLIDKHYIQLITALKVELQKGLANAEILVKQQRVFTYWNIGRHLQNYFSKQAMPRSERAEYIRQISKELNFQTDMVLRMMKFYVCYPYIPKKPKLNWVQYRALLGAPEGKRKNLEKQAIKENLGSEKILEVIKQLKLKETQNNSANVLTADNLKKLSLERGQLHIYKIIQSKQLPFKSGEILIDCGFSIRRKIHIKTKTLFRGGAFVKSERISNEYYLKIAEYKDTNLFTFLAYVERVVDGDTVIAHIDCGFDNWVIKRLRLRGINTPERKTVAGLEVKRFVERKLPKHKPIVIKTYHVGKYGRELADIFYHPEKCDPYKIAKTGIFLNQELLDLGLAELY